MPTIMLLACNVGGLASAGTLVIVSWPPEAHGSGRNVVSFIDRVYPSRREARIMPDSKASIGSSHCMSAHSKGTHTSHRKRKELEMKGQQRRQRKKEMLKKCIFTLAILLLYSSSAMANGALAIDRNKGAQYGFSYDYPSRQGARSRALQECGVGCSIVLEYSTGCAAYAADQAYGSTVYGWATAPDSSYAQSMAISECHNRGGSQCIVRVWGCNSY